MNIFFDTPEFMQEARKSRKGYPLWLEIFIFTAVFFTGTILESIPSVVHMLIRIFSSNVYFSIVYSENTQQLMEILFSNDFYTIVSLFSTIIMIGTVLIYCRFIEKRKLRTLGFIKKSLVKEYALGLVIGALIFSCAILICMTTGTLAFKGISQDLAAGTIILFFLAYMVQGMSEEVLCRGYLMVSISRRSSLAAAVMANSIVFACLHLLNPGISILAFVNLVLFGVFASLYMLRRGSIWGAAAIHSAWNFVQGNLFGISVSGTGKTTSILSSSLSYSGRLINGGAFGLEGGLAVTIVLLAGIAAVIFLPKRLEP